MEVRRSHPDLTEVLRASRQRVAVSLFAGAMAIAGGAAWATPVIDFRIQQPTSGILGYLGGGGPLTGLGIEVDFVVGMNTPINAGSYTCIDCTLSFQTGNLITAGANGWLFASGFGTSRILVRGGVDTDGDSIADIGGGSSLLMLGTFEGPQVSIDFLPGNPLAQGLSAGMFLDIKNPVLAAFFGLPPRPYEGLLVLGWEGLGDPPGPFRVTPKNGVVRNTFIPEPGSTLLLGAGLLMLLARRRRS
jgi:hypothetical protein